MHIALIGLAITSAASAQDRTILFGTADAGVSKAIPTWGLDTAWLDETNVRRGVVFMGQPQVDVIRFSFTPDQPLVAGTLNAAAQAEFDARMSIVNTYTDSHAQLYLNVDGAVDPWYKDGGGNTIADRWAQLINVTRQKAVAAGRIVASVAPFNEPDNGTDQGNVAKLGEICNLLRNGAAYSASFSGIRLAGGSTLNTDGANTWYEPLKGILDEGNTHQLAGSFDNYAAFHQNVQASGDVGLNDELHNVMEAMVGAEYGMDAGIWWGTAEYTRGEFVKASDGVRLGYAEHRPNWTAAAVYRAPSGAVRAFLGGSERQATTTSYRFFNRDRKVFYDGEGPRYDHTVVLPGGNGYWVDQPSAEKMVNITWGPDVQPAINGRYILVNRNSGKVMEVVSGSTADGADIRQGTYTGAAYQQWDVVPLDLRTGGDVSYFTIKAAHSGKAADLLNGNLGDGGDIIQWPTGGSNQHYFLEYVGNGWFNVRNRWSGKYLDVSGASTADGANILQWTGTGGINQQWRLLPVGASIEFVAPPTPSGLVAVSNPVSVRLTWNAVAAADLAGYSVFRSESPATGYETIARDLAATAFSDEAAKPGVTYYYRVLAVDRSLNRSAPTAPVSATPTGAPALVARYAFEGDARDSADNGNDAEISGAPAYDTGRVGASALALDGSGKRVNLPPTLARYGQFTVAAWVRWNGGGAWQRIFDFGNGTDQYLFLTPAAGGAGLRFAIKNGGAEQQLNAPALPVGQWTHVAVTFGGATARLYVNGAEVAASSAFTIKPSDFSPALNYIGDSQFDADPGFSGLIDEFRVYNYALSATDVSALVAGLPSAPANLSATPGPLQIQLAWSAVPYASGYTLKYATASGGPYSTLSTGATATAYLHGGLNYGQTYYYVVDATTLAGTGPASAPVGASPESATITEAERSSVRISVNVGADQSSAATLTVPASVPGHAYQVQYTDDLLKPWINVGSTQAGSGADLLLTLPAMPPSPRAFYRVLIQR